MPSEPKRDLRFIYVPKLSWMWSRKTVAHTIAKIDRSRRAGGSQSSTHPFAIVTSVIAKQAGDLYVLPKIRRQRA